MQCLYGHHGTWLLPRGAAPAAREGSVGAQVPLPQAPWGAERKRSSSRPRRGREVLPAAPAVFSRAKARGCGECLQAGGETDARIKSHLELQWLLGLFLI